MSVYVLGLALYKPSDRIDGLRLEEMVYHTARAALDDAGVTRGQLDSVTLGACDELDGRSISSMLMAMPAGAYLTDEIKVTDSAATALCLANARILSGDFHLCMVASWCKSSKTDVEAVMRFRGEPFFTRPFGLNMTVSDALFAQAVAGRFGIAPDETARRVVASYQRAARNPRGIGRAVPTEAEVAKSPWEATPLRAGHRAPLTDGAVCMVLASGAWLRRNKGATPLARVAGVGWATDSYRLDQARLREMHSAQTAWQTAFRQAGEGKPDVVEIEAQTGWHEAAYVRAFGLGADVAVSPSGGPFAQNPLFCTGLVGAAEAVLQVAGRAGPVQVPGARRAAAQSCHGYAQQGNVVMVFDTAKREASHA
jgi:acetyl-CoA acetyltransferase